MKTAFALAAVTGLLSSVSATPFFSVIAARSGSPIHLQSLNANGEKIWIGKATTSFCPASVKKQGGCPPGKNTDFSGGDVGLFMGSTIPGGQQAYINPTTGALKFSIAHAAPPAGSDLGGWTHTYEASYGVLSHKHGLFACPKGTDGPYQIYVPVTGVTLPADCLGFDALTSNVTKADAWEYE